MNKSYKSLLLTMVGLVVAIAAVNVLIPFIFTRPSMDIHLHDTYFVIEYSSLFIPLTTMLFLLVTERKHRYRRILPTILLGLSVLCVLFFIVFFSYIFIKADGVEIF